MLPVINVVLPVFAIILSGYLAGRFKVLGKESGDVLQRFVFFVAMPVLLFYAMARVEVADVLNWPYLSAYLGGQAITFVLAIIVAKFLFKRRLAESALGGMAGIYGNTGYMGIPLIMAAFGPDWAVPAIIATVVNAAVVIGVVAAIIEIDLSVGDDVSDIPSSHTKCIIFGRGCELGEDLVG
jgi:malonate transporter